MKVEFPEPISETIGKADYSTLGADNPDEYAEKVIQMNSDRPDIVPFSNNGHLPNRFKSWDELDNYLYSLRDDGYIVRTVVARWNVGNNEAMQIWNWGIITAFNRYQTTGGPGPYKPIVVQWVSNGKTSAELPEDLFIVYPCPGFNVLVDFFNEQRKGHSIK